MEILPLVMRNCEVSYGLGMKELKESSDGHLAFLLRTLAFVKKENSSETAEQHCIHLSSVFRLGARAPVVCVCTARRLEERFSSAELMGQLAVSLTVGFPSLTPLKGSPVFPYSAFVMTTSSIAACAQFPCLSGCCSRLQEILCH